MEGVIQMSDRIEQISKEVHRQDTYRRADCCVTCIHCYIRNHCTCCTYECHLLDKVKQVDAEMVCNEFERNQDD